MGHDVATLALPPRLQLARHDARGRGRDHRIRAKARLHLGVEGAFGRQILGAVLLHPIGRLDRRRGALVERRRRRRTRAHQPQALERGPGPLDEALHARRTAGGRIVDRDLVAAGQEQRGPARADRAGAEHRDPSDLAQIGGGGAHRRYSILPSTPIAWPETSRPASEHEV